MHSNERLKCVVAGGVMLRPSVSHHCTSRFMKIPELKNR